MMTTLSGLLNESYRVVTKVYLSCIKPQRNPVIATSKFKTFITLSMDKKAFRGEKEKEPSRGKKTNTYYDASSSHGAFTRGQEREDILQIKERYLSMPLDEKRKMYKCCFHYVTLDGVKAWNEQCDGLVHKDELPNETPFTVSECANKKVSIWSGDITHLEIDAIVNAANQTLLGGGGVDGAIHASAGLKLKAECSRLDGCESGQAKITGGYCLPARYVIHTVGPIGEQPKVLQSCYQECLRLVKENKLTTVAFPCISTGIYGYPNEEAAHVALETVRIFLDRDEYAEKIQRIIFCLFLKIDIKIYQKLMPYYFPFEKNPVEGLEEREGHTAANKIKNPSSNLSDNLKAEGTGSEQVKKDSFSIVHEKSTRNENTDGTRGITGPDAASESLDFTDESDNRETLKVHLVDDARGAETKETVECELSGSNEVPIVDIDDETKGKENVASEANMNSKDCCQQDVSHIEVSECDDHTLKKQASTA